MQWAKEREGYVAGYSEGGGAAKSEEPKPLTKNQKRNAKKKADRAAGIEKVKQSPHFVGKRQSKTWGILVSRAGTRGCGACT
jgi:hypothetical protein